MQIYNYDRDTLEFTCVSLAEKNQVGSGYLLPAFATFTAPPDFKENEKPFFKNGKWVIEPYFKGKKQVELSTKQVSTVDYFGKLKPGFQIVTEKVAQDLNENPDKYKVKDNKLTKLSKSEYEQLLKQQEIQKEIIQIQNQLDELDLKTIRAMRDGGEKEAGLTWVNYYNQQIIELRNKKSELEAQNE